MTTTFRDWLISAAIILWIILAFDWLRRGLPREEFLGLFVTCLIAFAVVALATPGVKP